MSCYEVIRMFQSFKEFLSHSLVHDCLSVEGRDRPHANTDRQTRFCSCDLDLDPMTLIHELDLKILKVYVYTRNKLSRSRFPKVRALQTDRHTDIQTRLKTLPCIIRGWFLIIKHICTATDLIFSLSHSIQLVGWHSGRTPVSGRRTFLSCARPASYE